LERKKEGLKPPFLHSPSPLKERDNKRGVGGAQPLFKKIPIPLIKGGRVDRYRY